MSQVHESLELQVLRIIEELLKDRASGARPVDTIMVCVRMRVEDPKAKDEIAEAMGDLFKRGDAEGPPPLTGDNKVLDVTVKAITPQGLKRLYK